MSVCLLLAADRPILTDRREETDFRWYPFQEGGLYTGKPWTVALEPEEHGFPAVADCLRQLALDLGSVELWKVWLSGYWEYEDRPIYYRQTVPAGELTPAHVRELADCPIWQDRERPAFWCLEIIGKPSGNPIPEERKARP